MFHVGQRVVCVHDEWVGHSVQVKEGIPCPLKVGQVYTVTRENQHGGFGIDGISRKKLCLWLSECEHPQPSIGFDARRFRPVISRPTDISIFKELLRNPYVGISEDA